MIYANQLRWTWVAEQAEAFGANVPNDNPAALGVFTYNLRFPGQIYDAATGLSYNDNRIYVGRSGRYLTSDPIGLAGGVNTYLYANANSLSYTDPLGLASKGGKSGSGTGSTSDVQNLNQRRQDAENTSDPSSASGTILCALTGKGCLDPDSLRCAVWLCTPKCGEPYRIYRGQHSLTSPETPCKCVIPEINPDFDKPLPGL